MIQACDTMRDGRSDTAAERAPVAGFATVADAAVFTKLSAQMIYKLIAAGKIPAVRFGRASLRIPWRWLHEQAGG